jgi:4-alpha-glucanotransferase
MPFNRSSGVLLHPTSLPGRFGIGDLGPSAFEFIDVLASAGQGLWQVLPLGPTGYGDSPYQSISAFAGNPLVISLERLIEDGLLTESAARDQYVFRPGNVDFPTVIAHRRALWPRVHDRFEAVAPSQMRSRFDAFCSEHADWLDDFALFMAVKDALGQAAWATWEPDIGRSRSHRSFRGFEASWEVREAPQLAVAAASRAAVSRDRANARGDVRNVRPDLRT